MKKFTGVFAFIVLLFAFSASPVFAHTHLDTSDPEEGSTVTETLDDITLYFETVIEDSAVMELHAEDGTEIALDNLTVNEDEFSADVTEPLENGTYTLSWDIIGVDGHPMEDSISFEVDIDETAVEDEDTNADKETENAEDASEEQADENEAAPESGAQEEAVDDTNSNTLLIAVLVIAIIAVIAIVLLKRKK